VAAANFLKGAQDDCDYKSMIPMVASTREVLRYTTWSTDRSEAPLFCGIHEIRRNDFLHTLLGEEKDLWTIQKLRSYLIIGIEKRNLLF
jgi:hypothetical protein